MNLLPAWVCPYGQQWAHVRAHHNLVPLEQARRENAATEDER